MKLKTALKNIRRATKKFLVFFDPFLVIGIFILFLIPTLTVINLTPQYLSQPQKKEVLGVNQDSELRIIPNNTINDGIKIQDYEPNTNGIYQFNMSHPSHTAGKYTNKLFSCQNSSKRERPLTFSISAEELPQQTRIAIRYNDTNYILLHNDGNMYTPTLKVPATSNAHFFLTIDSENDTYFESSFSIYVSAE